MIRNCRARSSNSISSITRLTLFPTIAVKAGNRTLSKDELKIYMAALGDDTVDMALKLALFSGGQRMAQLLRAILPIGMQTLKHFGC